MKEGPAAATRVARFEREYLFELKLRPTAEHR